VASDDCYEVFAGGTRLEAARRAGLTTVPVFVHEGLTDEDVCRKADEDNENDEYHTPVSLLDIWAECYRLWKEEGWTQQQIAEAKRWERSVVANRIRLHQFVPRNARRAVLDDKFDEGHCQAFLGVVLDVQHFSPWLTTSQAQTELVDEVLSRHRGSSQGLKPTVKVVRDTAQRWKNLIQAAVDAWESLSEGPWRQRFVELLTSSRARTEAAVKQALSQTITEQRRAEENEAARLRAAADEKEREAQRLQQAERRLRYVEAQTKKLLCGDARELIVRAPTGFHLLLTDPPYGVGFQSHRRVTTARKEQIANDGKDEAVALLADVLTTAIPLMAEDATCLIFTGWRNEPDFRRVIEQAGFTIRGSLVWVKNNHGAGDLTGAFAPQHERIIHAVKGNPKLVRRAADVLSGHDAQNSEHPMEKPRDLLRQLIETVTQPGDTVVDPFFGTGNTLLEAYTLERDFFGIELDEGWHRQAVEAIHHLAEERCPHDLAS
jgi:DNA modification methylase